MASNCTVPRQSAGGNRRYCKRMKRFGAPLTAWRWIRSVLIAVGVLLGAAFVLYIQQNPDRPVETLAYTGLFKLSAVACFSLVSFMQAITGVASATDVSEGPANASGMYSMMLGCGLLLSCLGDFSLEMHLSGREVLFMAGLGFFLVGHICYIVAFWASGMTWTSPTFLLAVLLSAGYGTWAASQLVGGIPADQSPLQGPVVAYVAIICVMLASSFGWTPRLQEGKSPVEARGRAGATLATARMVAAIGAVMFTLSDSILGFDRFRPDMVKALTAAVGAPWLLQHVRAAVMVTYYGGQCLLCCSGEWCELGMGQAVEDMGKGGQEVGDSEEGSKKEN